jgi:hypothetical protein
MKGRGGLLCFLCVLLCKSIQLEFEQEETEKAEGSFYQHSVGWDCPGKTKSNL